MAGRKCAKAPRGAFSLLRQTFSNLEAVTNTRRHNHLVAVHSRGCSNHTPALRYGKRPDEPLRNRHTRAFLWHRRKVGSSVAFAGSVLLYYEDDDLAELVRAWGPRAASLARGPKVSQVLE